jgi:hypothetical protein
MKILPLLIISLFLISPVLAGNVSQVVPVSNPAGQPGSLQDIWNWIFNHGGGGAGQPGAPGPMGPQGMMNQTMNQTPGPATIDVNDTFPLPPLTPPKVINVGNLTDALLDFYIPFGEMNMTPNQTANMTPGTPGAPGTAATILINLTATVPAGTPAAVNNIGTVNAAIFDFFIPQGPKGDKGDKGDTGQMNQTPNLTAGATGPAGPNQVTGTTTTTLTGVLCGNGALVAVCSVLSDVAYATQAWVTGQGYLVPSSVSGFINSSSLSPYELKNNATSRYQNISNQSTIDNLQTANELLDYRSDTSRYFTGGELSRERNNSYFEFWGGLPVLGSGAVITMFGSDYGYHPGWVQLDVPNAAKSGLLIALTISGVTDSPIISMNNNQVQNINGITSSTFPASAQANALCYNSGTGTITYNSGLTTCLASSESTKTNITYLSTSQLYRISQLKPAFYTSLIDSKLHYGLIAQDVANIIPELIGHNETGGITGVRYEELTALLLKGIQELITNNTAQQATINNLTSQLGTINKTYIGTKGAAIGKSNSAPVITHGLGTTPTGCNPMPSVANTSLSVTAMTSTTFTINGTMVNKTNTNMITQTVYWECWQ